MQAVKSFFFIGLLSVVFWGSSCYVYEFNVGNGAQTGVKVTEKNHYFVYGLAKGNTSDPTEMAKGTDNYTVRIEHSFIDGLINGLTFGLYNPTTTTVTK